MNSRSKKPRASSQGKRTAQAARLRVKKAGSAGSSLRGMLRKTREHGAGQETEVVGAPDCEGAMNKAPLDQAALAARESRGLPPALPTPIATFTI